MSFSIPINLIRQWHYCPRVAYYQEMTELRSLSRPIWVKQGEKFHTQETHLWKRRNLSRFHLEKGKKHDNLSMKDPELGMHGIVDMVIETEDAVYPIEFKLNPNDKKKGYVLQLVAYAMLAQQHFKKPCLIGFLAGSGKKLCQIKIDETKRMQVIQTIQKIRTTLEKGQKPESSASVAQCSACEYINFCNDRL